MKTPIKIKIKWDYGRGVADSDELHAKLSSAVYAWVQREIQSLWDRLEENPLPRQSSARATIPIGGANVGLEAMLTVKRAPAQGSVRYSGAGNGSRGPRGGEMKRIAADPETITMKFTWREFQLINNALCTCAKADDPPEIRDLVKGVWSLGLEHPPFFKQIGQQLFGERGDRN